MESLIVPYESVRMIGPGPALVFAPHPDDEVFGCGGAIMRHVAAGDPVRVVVLTDGACDPAGTGGADYAQVRENESIAAGRVLGYGQPEFWRLPDRALEYGEALVCRLLEAINSFSPGLVYAPSLQEAHPDHRALAMAAIEAVRRAAGSPALAMYEVGMPLQPNRLLDITDVADRKAEAMRCFESQLSRQPYDQQIAALNRFRTYTLAPDVTAAEAYRLISRGDVIRDYLQFFESEYQRHRRIGLTAERDASLVSIVIRSIGRETLAQALDSVALQTYPNIEVVVVNAKGADHPVLEEWCGRFPLRMAGGQHPLSRSRAANLGLDQARGEHLLFLDDDDWLAPNHVSLLRGALKENSAALVAYAGVEIRAGDRQPVETGSMNESFDAARLRAGNFIPIHAVLFPRSLPDRGLRFDESFEVYEDWDFLLQLSERTGFVHVPEISAYYRASGTSGVGVTADEALQRHARERIFEKWRHLWTGAQINEMVNSRSTTQLDALRKKIEEATRKLEVRDKALMRASSAIADLESRLQEKEQELQRVTRYLQSMFASTSWRLSAPVRWIGRLVLAMRRAARKGVRRLFGITPWPPGPAEVTQGFAGEVLHAPDVNHFYPLISVIMPVFNACRISNRYLLDALESIAGQTYRNIELIIVDDGSTDDTRRICEDFLRSHPDLRGRYLYKDNGGQSSARNMGVRNCAGDYIGFIDQDDMWYEDKLERIVPWLTDPGIGVLYTDADIVDENGNVAIRSIHRTHDRAGWPHPKRSIEDILFKDIFVMPGVMIIRRDAFDRAGGFDENLSGYEDDDLFLRLYQTSRVFYLPVSTLRWRMYGENYSFSHRMLTSRTYYWRKLLDGYTDHGADRFRVHMISFRFFWEFLNRALDQYRNGNELYRKSLAGAKEIRAYLPALQRVLFGAGFLLPESLMMRFMQWGKRIIGEPR